MPPSSSSSPSYKLNNPLPSPPQIASMSTGFQKASNGKLFTKDVESIFAMLILSLNLSSSGPVSSSKSKTASLIPSKIRRSYYPYSFYVEDALQTIQNMSVSIITGTTKTTITCSVPSHSALTFIQRFMSARLLHCPSDRTHSKPVSNIILQPTAKGVYFVERYCRKNGIYLSSNAPINALLGSVHNSMKCISFDRHSITDELICNEAFVFLLFQRLMGPYPNVYSPSNGSDPIPYPPNISDLLQSQSGSNHSSNQNSNIHSSTLNLAFQDLALYSPLEEKNFEDQYQSGNKVESPYYHRYYTHPDSDALSQYYVSSKGVRLFKNKKFDVMIGGPHYSSDYNNNSFYPNTPDSKDKHASFTTTTTTTTNAATTTTTITKKIATSSCYTDSSPTIKTITVDYCFTGRALWQWLLDCTDVVYQREAMHLANLFFVSKMIEPILTIDSKCTARDAHIRIAKNAFYRLSPTGKQIVSWDCQEHVSQIQNPTKNIPMLQLPSATSPGHSIVISPSINTNLNTPLSATTVMTPTTTISTGSPFSTPRSVNSKKALKVYGDDASDDHLFTMVTDSNYKKSPSYSKPNNTQKAQNASKKASVSSSLAGQDTSTNQSPNAKKSTKKPKSRPHPLSIFPSVLSASLKAVAGHLSGSPSHVSNSNNQQNSDTNPLLGSASLNFTGSSSSSSASSSASSTSSRSSSTSSISVTSHSISSPIFSTAQKNGQPFLPTPSSSPSPMAQFTKTPLSTIPQSPAVSSNVPTPTAPLTTNPFLSPEKQNFDLQPPVLSQLTPSTPFAAKLNSSFERLCAEMKSMPPLPPLPADYDDERRNEVEQSDDNSLIDGLEESSSKIEYRTSMSFKLAKPELIHMTSPTSGSFKLGDAASIVTGSSRRSEDISSERRQSGFPFMNPIIPAPCEFNGSNDKINMDMYFDDTMDDNRSSFNQPSNPFCKKVENTSSLESSECNSQYIQDNSSNRSSISIVSLISNSQAEVDSEEKEKKLPINSEYEASQQPHTVESLPEPIAHEEGKEEKEKVEEKAEEEKEPQDLNSQTQISNLPLSPVYSYPKSKSSSFLPIINPISSSASETSQSVIPQFSSLPSPTVHKHVLFTQSDVSKLNAVTEGNRSHIINQLSNKPLSSMNELDTKANDNNKKEDKNGGLSLSKILNDAALRFLFREFLQSQHCEENLQFYSDLDRFLADFDRLQSIIYKLQLKKQVVKAVQKRKKTSAMKNEDGSKEKDKEDNESEQNEDEKEEEEDNDNDEIDILKSPATNQLYQVCLNSIYIMYYRYLAVQSPCELNIDSQLRTKLVKTMTEHINKNKLGSGSSFNSTKSDPSSSSNKGQQQKQPPSPSSPVNAFSYFSFHQPIDSNIKVLKTMACHLKEAKWAVYQMMEHDSLPKFIESQMYMKGMMSLNSFYTTTTKTIITPPSSTVDNNSNNHHNRRHSLDAKDLMNSGNGIVDAYGIVNLESKTSKVKFQDKIDIA